MAQCVGHWRQGWQQHSLREDLALACASQRVERDAWGRSRNLERQQEAAALADSQTQMGNLTQALEASWKQVKWLRAATVMAPWLQTRSIRARRFSMLLGCWKGQALSGRLALQGRRIRELSLQVHF